jgi:hypothetical protein
MECLSHLSESPTVIRPPIRAMHNRHLRLADLAALTSANALCAQPALAGEIAFDGSLPGTTAGTLNAVNGTVQKTASAATQEALRVALADTKVSATEGCR